MSEQPRSGEADSRAEMSLSKAAREARLGLVVYGGVSLAIYINGVTDELFRAHRGRGIYKLLKRLLDSDIVVDIISGTSAGGINGLLLAYALTNEREFSDCASLWREQGSLTKLLRLIDDDVNTTSLLNTKNYYLPHLERAFRTMDDIAPEVRRQERPSSCEELDLFVTGTSFDGELSTAVDATGRRIDIKTHRAVFHLKHRAGRKTPFRFPLQASQRTDVDEARVAALARLSAITSCFPAAFEPVKVAPSPANPHEQRVYEWLKEWGSLEGETWFLDGGVLDNKPFSYTVKEIFNRTALKPVDRKVLYVEPDPERFTAAKPARTEAPNIVQAAVQALLGIPGYESIADDLEQVVQRNDRIGRLVKARQAAQRALDALKQADASTARAIPASVAAVYRHTRLSQLTDRALRGLMEGNEFTHQLSEKQTPKSPAEKEEQEKRHKDAGSLAKAFAEWEGDGDETLERYDVYLRRRHIFHVINRVFGWVSELCDASWDAKAVAAARSYQDVWWKLNEQLSAYDIVLWALEQKLDARRLPQDLASTDGAATEVWRMLKRDFDCVLEVDSEMAAALDAEVFIDAHRHMLHQKLKARIKTDSPPESVTAAGAERPLNLLERLDAQTSSIVAAAAAEHHDLAEAWADFRWHDAHFFPIDYFGDLGEKGAIDVIRVSPIDAERAFSNRRFEDKITGETVMHFGAFLKKSWRSNDIMWGRLDGACRLLDVLLTPRTLGRAVANPEVRELLAQDLRGELSPAVLFPHAGPRIQADVTAWLEKLTSRDDAARNQAVQDEESRELLLWCAQLEILQEELPKVLEDAATEQLEWNNVRTNRGFRSSALRLDRNVGLIDSRQSVSAFMKGLQENPSEFSVIRNAPIAKYFIKDYAVGGETAQNDIPPAVLAETITAVSIVARNCLVHAFPKQGERLRANLVFKAMVDWPLMMAHTLAVFARRERTFYLAGLAMLYTYALLALVGGVVVLEVDLKTGEEFSQTKVIFLVVIPLLILVIGGYLAWVRALSHAGRSWPAAIAKGALYLTTLALAAPIVVAFVAAWKHTNETLRLWFQAAPDNEWARLLLPDRFLAWLAGSVSANQWLIVTFYPLAAMVVLLVVVIPAMRGFLQSRMARRVAVVSVTESARELTAKAASAGKAAGKRCATAYSSMRDRLTPKTP